MSDTADRAPVTRLLDGRLLLRQPETGHRVGTDAILLAAATLPVPGETVVDVGSGVGSVGLAVALRHREARIRLVEVMPALAALARDNIALNGCQGRADVDEVDLFDRARPGMPLGDWVVSNPPFHGAGEGRPSPDALRARAHSLGAQPRPGTGHGDWLRAMLALAAPHAALVLIHRPEALPALLEAAAGRMGQIRVTPIHAHAEAPAIRMLFGGIAGSRAPFGFTEALVLHQPGGAFTPRAERLHRGEEGLPLIDKKRSRPRQPAP